MASASEMPAATPVAPLGLAAYQEGAVVSRTLLKRAGGTITLFTFDEGQALSEHTAPFDAVAHVLEGEAEITIAGTPLKIAKGELVLMPGQSAARRACAYAVQDAVDDDPLGLIGAQDGVRNA
jgi:quercetin dioxygenase-like cupin family protein